MMGHLQMLEYRKLMTAILLTFVVVMVIDRMSFWIRSRCGGFTAQRSE
jgi:ABC-type phosphate/phosphonate transport system permease subunit